MRGGRRGRRRGRVPLRLARRRARAAGGRAVGARARAQAVAAQEDAARPVLSAQALRAGLREGTVAPLAMLFGAGARFHSMLLFVYIRCWSGSSIIERHFSPRTWKSGDRAPRPSDCRKNTPGKNVRRASVRLTKGKGKEKQLNCYLSVK